MATEALFRTMVIAGLVILVPVGLYHRLKAHGAGDRIDRRAEGWFILLTLRPVAAVGILGVGAYAIDPAWMAWSRCALPVGLRWLSAGLGIVGIGLFVWSFRALGPNLTDTVAIRARHVLVTGGPYRYVRHPFYVACAVIVVATTGVTANWLIGLSGVVSLALLVRRTATEERHLRARFGQAYEAYAARTGRFWPRWRTARGQRTP